VIRETPVAFVYTTNSQAGEANVRIQIRIKTLSSSFALLPCCPVALLPEPQKQG